MSNILLSFNRYQQERLRKRRRKQRMEDVYDDPQKPVEGEPMNPDLAIPTEELN